MPRLLLLILLILQPTGSGTIPCLAGLEPLIHTATLDNGLEVVVCPAGRAPVAAVQVWYRVGGRNESAEEHGLAHLFEHMMFRGTATVGSEEHSRLIQSVGGRANAYTSEDVTVYHQVLPSEHLELALTLEADRMVNLALDKGMLETERQVVLEEMRLRRDNDPFGAAYAWYKTLFFREHTYRHDVIGTPDSLNQVTAEDCRRFYHRHYTPDNAVLVIAGGVDAQEVLDQARSHFGDIPTGTVADTASPEPEPFGEGLVRGKLELDVEVPALGVGFHVPEAAHPDFPVLEVIRELLTGGSGSRLTRSLEREKRLAVYVDTIFEPTIDPAAWVAFAVFLPSIRAARVEKAVWEEIDRLRLQTVPEQELEQARRRLAVRELFGRSGPEGAAAAIGRAAVIEGDAGRFAGYAERIRAVTAEDVLRVAGTYLVRQNAVVGVVRPDRFRPRYFLLGLLKSLLRR